VVSNANRGADARATIAAVPPRAADRLATLLARAEADPASVASDRAAGDALALEVDRAESDLALRWRIAVLRALMAAPPDADAVREAYGELVDRYRGEPAHLAALKALGDDIRKLEADGTLPRTLVARSARPRRESR
jgi:hypothetical protein